MANLTARLLDPETFEKRLDFFMKVQLWDTEKQELAAAIRELHARAEQYRQNWLSLQKSTGEECHLRALEVIREIPELHARLRTAKADLAAAREDVVRMRKQIADHEEAEASVCPEDVGFVEFIGVLQKRIAGLAGASNLWKKAAEAQHTMRQTTKPEKLDAALTWIENDELADKWLEEARTALAAQPPRIAEEDEANA